MRTQILSKQFSFQITITDEQALLLLLVLGDSASIGIPIMTEQLKPIIAQVLAILGSPITDPSVFLSDFENFKKRVLEGVNKNVEHT